MLFLVMPGQSVAVGVVGVDAGGDVLVKVAAVAGHPGAEGVAGHPDIGAGGFVVVGDACFAAELVDAWIFASQ